MEITRYKNLTTGKTYLEILRKIISREVPSDEEYEQFQSQLNGFAMEEVGRLREQFDSVRHMLKSRVALFGSDPRMEEIFENSLNGLFVDILEVLDPDNQKVREFQIENGIESAVIGKTRPTTVDDLQNVVRLSLDHLIFCLVANGYEPTPKIIINLIKSKFPRLDAMVHMDINDLLMDSIPGEQDRKPKHIYQKFESVVASIFYHSKVGINRLDENVLLKYSLIEKVGKYPEKKPTRIALEALEDAFTELKHGSTVIDHKIRAYFQDEPDWQVKWNEARENIYELYSEGWNTQIRGVVHSVLEEQLSFIPGKDFFETRYLNPITGEKTDRQRIRVGLANTLVYSPSLDISDPLYLDPVYHEETYNWKGLCLSVFFGHYDAASEFLNRRFASSTRTHIFPGGKQETWGVAYLEPVLLGRLLRLAVERNYVEVAKVLLEHSTYPEVEQDKLELTSGIFAITGSLLGLAIASENIEMIDLLLEETDLPNPWIEQDIQEASRCKNPAVLERLAKHGVELEALISTDRMTLLHIAQSPEVGAFLLGRGLDPNARNAAGDTPLHTCVFGSYFNSEIAKPVTDRESLRFAKLLILNGADFLAKGYEGRQVHHLAALANNTELLKYLIENTALELEATDDMGRTCMHHIAMQGRRYSEHKRRLQPIEKWKIAPLLLADMKANINAQDIDGWSPLHHAARLNEGHDSDGLSECELFIKYGADPSLETHDGEKASDFAREVGSFELEKLLLAAEKTTPLHIAAMNNSVDLARLLIERPQEDPKIEN